MLVAKYLRDNPDTCLLMFGDREAESLIREEITGQNLESRVILTPFVSYDELVRHICLADVSINTFIPSLVTHCVLPGRVLQSMACGIPVVSTPLQGMMNYSQGTDTVIYRALDESFVEAVSELLSDTARRKKLGVAGRVLVISKGSWQNFVPGFSALASNLVSSK